MKVALNLVVVLVLGLGWFHYFRGRINAERPWQQIEAAEARGEPVSDERRNAVASQVDAEKSQLVGIGLMLSFVTAGYCGLVVVAYVLPALAHRATHAIYDSGEMVETDVMHDARALVAQGDWHGAIEAFREAAKELPGQRLPWVEIAKIQRENLEDPDAAIATMMYVLEHFEWQPSDAAYLLFRLAELYDEDKQDRNSAANIMQQVIAQFPETRHSANARHRLREWGFA